MPPQAVWSSILGSSPPWVAQTCTRYASPPRQSDCARGMEKTPQRLGSNRGLEACTDSWSSIKCVHNDSQTIPSKAFIMETTKVGIREFRSDLAEYIASNTPVAVTRHGQTVGYFIPTQGQVEADLAALKKASKALDKLLEAQGVDVEAVVADFKAARQKATQPKKLKVKTA